MRKTASLALVCSLFALNSTSLSAGEIEDKKAIQNLNEETQILDNLLAIYSHPDFSQEQVHASNLIRATQASNEARSSFCQVSTQRIIGEKFYALGQIVNGLNEVQKARGIFDKELSQNIAKIFKSTLENVTSAIAKNKKSLQRLEAHLAAPEPKSDHERQILAIGTMGNDQIDALASSPVIIPGIDFQVRLLIKDSTHQISQDRLDDLTKRIQAKFEQVYSTLSGKHWNWTKTASFLHTIDIKVIDKGEMEFKFAQTITEYCPLYGDNKSTGTHHVRFASEGPLLGDEDLDLIFSSATEEAELYYNMCNN